MAGDVRDEADFRHGWHLHGGADLWCDLRSSLVEGKAHGGFRPVRVPQGTAPRGVVVAI